MIDETETDGIGFFFKWEISICKSLSNWINWTKMRYEVFCTENEKENFVYKENVWESLNVQNTWLFLITWEKITFFYAWRILIFNAWLKT